VGDITEWAKNGTIFYKFITPVMCMSMTQKDIPYIKMLSFLFGIRHFEFHHTGILFAQVHRHRTTLKIAINLAWLSIWKINSSIYSTITAQNSTKIHNQCSLWISIGRDEFHMSTECHNQHDRSLWESVWRLFQALPAECPLMINVLGLLTIRFLLQSSVWK